MRSWPILAGILWPWKSCFSIRNLTFLMGKVERQLGFLRVQRPSEASGKLSGLPSLRLTWRWRREKYWHRSGQVNSQALEEAVICVLSQGAQTFKDDIAPSRKSPEMKVGERKKKKKKVEAVGGGGKALIAPSR